MSDIATRGLEQAQAFLAGLPRAAERAVAAALNRASVQGRDESVAAIDRRYAVNPGDVREKIQISSATPDKLSVSIVARSPSLSLGYFPHSPSVAGTGGRGRPALHAEVLRGQAKSVRDAFVATINGRARIMMRTGGRTSTGKTAIRSVYSVPLALMLGAETVRAAVMSRIADVFDQHLGREIDRALGKAA